MAFAFFELAQNLQVQDRLYEILSQSLDGLDANSEAYYDMVMNQIPYLDAVIKENLRKYPAVKRLERVVGADEYKIDGVLLEKGVLVQIPTTAVHYNPEYYPDPERFNPDRFMPENKHLLVPYTYIPFGAGPRNCVGMRFAYQEIKFCLAKILIQFRFEPTDKTPSKLDFKHFKPTLNVNSFQLKVIRR